MCLCVCVSPTPRPFLGSRETLAGHVGSVSLPASSISPSRAINSVPSTANHTCLPPPLNSRDRAHLSPSPVSSLFFSSTDRALAALSLRARTPAMPGMDASDEVVTPVHCDFCTRLPAVVYCRADSARLCLPCDRHVHGANTVATRHARAPLCAACRAAAAAFRRGGRGFLCGNCDFDDRDGETQPLHDRGAVEGYTGCPSIGELAVVLGVGGGCEKDAGWWSAASAWEEPQVLRLEDVIVPTTSCHGLQPLVTPSFPKKLSSGGQLNDEVIRQLGELAKAEAEPADDGGQQLLSWASSDYTIGHVDFAAFDTETCHEAASMAVPSCEKEPWIAADCNMDTTRTTEEAREQAPAPALAISAAAEPNLSSFVDISEICPAMSHDSSAGDNLQQRDPATTTTPQAPAKKGGYDVSYPDRGTVISRYKEKRKNRRFGKQIRYESRKARADGRLRIKGRFAKTGEI